MAGGLVPLIGDRRAPVQDPDPSVSRVGQPADGNRVTGLQLSRRTSGSPSRRPASPDGCRAFRVGSADVFPWVIPEFGGAAGWLDGRDGLPGVIGAA
jgi:hypothetical protein